MGLPIPSARELVDGSTSAEEQSARRSANTVVKSAREVATEYDEFVQEMTKATIAGLNGATEWDMSSDAARGYVGTAAVAPIRRNPSRHSIVTKALDDYEMAKSAEGGPEAWDRLSKEWTLTTPVSTGLNYGAAA